MKKVLLLTSCFFLMLLSSCSSYLNSIYNDFEQQERSNNDIDTEADSFDQFRNPKRKTSKVYNKTDRTITTANTKTITPDIKRKYLPEKEVNKRYTASDLVDNGSDGSLWAGSDPNAFLFSNNKNKNTGDIVQILVQSSLKNEITMELKKNFPENPFEKKEKKADGSNSDAKESSAKNDEKDKKESIAESEGANSAQDKISGVIVEEINRDHLLIKGRKNVLYKNRKRMVEVQALISRKDITDNDTIDSDAILESNVSVVR